MCLIIFMVFTQQYKNTYLLHRSIEKHDTKEHCAYVQKHIYYLKVHKTGSTTFTNMLFRYGLANNLTFAVFEPRHPYPAMDMTKYLLPHPAEKRHSLPHSVDIKDNTGFPHKYDILNSHSIFNESVIGRFMPNDTVFIATVRHPFNQLQSAFYYYNLSYHLSLPNSDNPVRFFL